MKKKKTNNEPKLYEYRIKYNAGSRRSAMNSFHYFQAFSAGQALEYHLAMMNNKGYNGQTLSVEKKDPYANKWILEDPYQTTED
jgi:hypothetical protein